ncbi:unnamed protein product [Arabidopsis arenosa]|uniref:Uncharacterized protein n=1 Tax=Arabidopsis arenosa TaxID=38785 RepID=A0A8S2AXP8_ARAAE|nr:unnamed protein product [Arabidopsis arenosa]
MEFLRKPLPAAFRVYSNGQFCDEIRLKLENDFRLRNNQIPAQYFGPDLLQEDMPDLQRKSKSKSPENDSLIANIEDLEDEDDENDELNDLGDDTFDIKNQVETTLYMLELTLTLDGNVTERQADELKSSMEALEAVIATGDNNIIENQIEAASKKLLEIEAASSGSSTPSVQNVKGMTTKKSSLVRDQKVYAVDGTDRTLYYSPSLGQWGRGNRGEVIGNRRDWCMIDNLIFFLTRNGTVIWCEPDELDWRETEGMVSKEVKGLGFLKKSLSCSRLVHFGEQIVNLWEKYKIKFGRPQKLIDLLPGARLSNSGGNIVLFWDVIEGDHLEIWCAEISLERRQGGFKLYMSLPLVACEMGTHVELMDVYVFPVVRASLFFGMGFSEAALILHKLIIFWDQPEALHTTGYEILMGLLYGLGVLVYATRIQERWIAGHSHQLFHVLVVAGAFTTHYRAGLVYLK